MTLLRFGLQHLAVLASWAAMATAFVGLGMLFRRAFTRGRADGSDLVLALWSGFAVSLLILVLWHFVLPIDAILTTGLAAAGMVGLVLSREDWRSAFSMQTLSADRVGLAMAAVFTVWVANRALGPLEYYDSGMYHVPTVEWANTYPLVPGLGNLHGRLAFNATSLLYAAVLDVGYWDGTSFHLANGFLLAALGAPLMVSVGRLLMRRPVHTLAQEVFAAVLVVPLFASLLVDGPRSLDTDLPVSVVLTYCGLRIFRALDTPPNDTPSARWQLAAVTLLLTAAITLKLSAVVLSGTLLLAALWAYRHSLRDVVTFLRVSAAPALLLVAWAARGVVLSGYPLYPSTVFGFPTPWRLDPEQAAAEAEWIRMSARTLNTNRIVAGTEWFVPWAKNLLSDVSLALSVPVPLAITLVSLVALGALAWRRRSDATRRLTGWPVLAAAFAGALFWFVVAPSPRFGPAPLWLAAATTLALLVISARASTEAVGRAVSRAARVTAALAVVGLAFLAMQPGTSSGPRWRRRAASLGRILTSPPPGGRLASMPAPTLVPYRTESGLELQMPRDNNLCWRGPLLCTPHPQPNLALREPGRLASGFIAEGRQWHPARWPNPWTPFLPFLACLRERSGQQDAERTCQAAALADTTVVPRGGRGRSPQPGAAR